MKIEGIQDWFHRRLEIADGLARDPTAVFDAEILLCCAMSSLAAIAWPGDRKDHRRYIEFLTRFVRSAPDVKLISVPILAQRLEQDPSHARRGRALRERFFPEPGRVYNYREIDKTEAEIRTVLPPPLPPIATIRESSYASIIYSDLRSGLVHEYALSSDLAGHPMSIESEIPHYVNMVIGTPPNVTRVKKLFLPYRYIRTVAEEAFRASCAYWESATTMEIPEPTPWWISG